MELKKGEKYIILMINGFCNDTQTYSYNAIFEDVFKLSGGNYLIFNAINRIGYNDMGSPIKEYRKGYSITLNDDIINLNENIIKIELSLICAVYIAKTPHDIIKHLRRNKYHYDYQQYKQMINTLKANISLLKSQ